MDMLYRLPWRDWLELEPVKTAPKEARHRLAGDLKEWSLRQFEVPATLVLSEIVTNSLAATADVPIRVWLLGGPSVVALLAWDVSTEAPVQCDAGEDGESGRGLAIVDSLSAGWGYYYPAAEYGGKVVWSIIDRP